MNKYKTNIDKLLNLEYADYFECISISDIDITECEKRIDGEYTFEGLEMGIINNHLVRTCNKSPKCDSCIINKYCKYYRNIKVYKKLNKYNVIDLFCGAGGFSLGFVQNDYEIKYAIDNQECCIETYRHNHPEVPNEYIVCDSIENSIDAMKLKLSGLDVDVVIGGPPCQGFSIANRQRLIDDPRNKLYKYFVRSVDALNPKFFVMENVQGILNLESQIIEDFSNLSSPYKVKAIKINAMDYGVPQNRKRVLFIGTRLNIDIDGIIKNIYDLRKEINRTVLKDALYKMRSLQANTIKNSTTKDSIKSGAIIEKNKYTETNDYLETINLGKKIKYVYNHKARYNNSRDIEIFSKLNQGDRSDDPKIIDIMPYASRNNIFKDKYFRLQEDKVSKTITAHMKYDCNMYIHPNEARGLTPREAARIQSYPDDYFFCGPYTKTFMQIGNSVPPLVSRTLARALKFVLDEYAKVQEIGN